MKLCVLPSRVCVVFSGPSTLRLLVTRILLLTTVTGSTSELHQSPISSISEERLASQPSRLTTVVSRETESAPPSTTKVLVKWSDTASSSLRTLVSLDKSSTKLKTARSNQLERSWQRRAPLTWTESPLNSWRIRRSSRSEWIAESLSSLVHDPFCWIIVTFLEPIS